MGSEIGECMGVRACKVVVEMVREYVMNVHDGDYRLLSHHLSLSHRRLQQATAGS